MPKKTPAAVKYKEDSFDLEKAKRGLNTVALAKARNKRLRRILAVARFFMMLASLGLFLLLFYLAMEIIALF